MRENIKEISIFSDATTQAKDFCFLNDIELFILLMICISQLAILSSDPLPTFLLGCEFL